MLLCSKDGMFIIAYMLLRTNFQTLQAPCAYLLLLYTNIYTIHDLVGAIERIILHLCLCPLFIYATRNMDRKQSRTFIRHKTVRQTH